VTSVFASTPRGRSPAPDVSVPSGDEDAARAVLDALSRNDVQAFGELASDDIEIDTARGARRGHAEAVAWAANKYDHLQRRYAVEDIELGEEGTVVVHGRTEYVWKEGGEVADASPVAIEMRFADGELVLWRFLDPGA
jgi:ketosteroid isomerase-like protein